MRAAFALLTLLAFAPPLAVSAQDTSAGQPGDAAAAQNAPPETDGEARGLFEAGRAAYDSGRFADAQGYFERAYELSGRPALLFNLGQAAQRAGNDDRAIEAYEGYLAELPEAENRGFVDSNLETLRERRVAQARARAAAREERERPPSESADDSEGGSVLPILFFSAAGVGAAVFITGAILASSNKSTVDEMCTEIGEGQLSCPEDARDAHSAVGTWALIADIGLGVAIAGLFAGVLSLVLSDDDEDPDVSGNASCGLTGCGASLRVRF